MSVTLRRLRCLLAATLLAAPSLQAHEFVFGDLRIIHPWATILGGASSRACEVYVVIMTQGADDRLLSVSTPAARSATLHGAPDHTSHQQAGQGIPVTASNPVLLVPKGAHIMLEDLRGPLKVDTHLPLTLTFEKAGPLTVEVLVQRDLSMPAGHDHEMPAQNGHSASHADHH